MALSASRLTLLEKLVSERTPLRVLQKEHGFNYKTVRKYFPDYRTKAVAIREDFYAVDDFTEKALYEMVDDRAPMSEIRKTLGLTRNQVLWLDKNGAWTKKESGDWSQMLQSARSRGIDM